MTELQRYNSLYESLSINNKLIHVGLLLKRAAQNWPNNTIVICDDKSITYKELYFRASSMAEQLRLLGVKPNDRVIIYYENSIEFYIAYFGVWHSGALVTPLNVFLQQTELAHIIKDSQPTVIIVSENLKSKLD